MSVSNATTKLSPNFLTGGRPLSLNKATTFTQAAANSSFLHKTAANLSLPRKTSSRKFYIRSKSSSSLGSVPEHALPKKLNSISSVAESNASPLIAHSLSAQFHKTRLCPFFARGHCRQGSECTYAHQKMELKVAPNLYRTKLCEEWQKGNCKNENCRFAHGRRELRFTHLVYKTRICHFWATGDCNKGKLCRHAHGYQELRTSLTQQDMGCFESPSPRSSSKNGSSDSIRSNITRNGTISRNDDSIIFEMQSAAEHHSKSTREPKCQYRAQGSTITGMSEAPYCDDWRSSSNIEESAAAMEKLRSTKDHCLPPSALKAHEYHGLHLLNSSRVPPKSMANCPSELLLDGMKTVKGQQHQRQAALDMLNDALKALQLSGSTAEKAASLQQIISESVHLKEEEQASSSSISSRDLTPFQNRDITYHSSSHSNESLMTPPPVPEPAPLRFNFLSQGWAPEEKSQLLCDLKCVGCSSMNDAPKVQALSQCYSKTSSIPSDLWNLSTNGGFGEFDHYFAEPSSQLSSEAVAKGLFLNGATSTQYSLRHESDTVSISNPSGYVTPKEKDDEVLVRVIQKFLNEQLSDA